LIENWKFTSVTGEVIVMNTDTIDYPIHEMTTEIEVRGARRNKSQQHGSWPGFQYLGTRIFHWTGAIVEDSSAEYWAQRLKLVKAFLPHPHLNKKVAGTLEVEYTGIGEPLICDCKLDGWPELPIVAGFVSTGDFLINLAADDPRLYGIERSSNSVAPPVSDYGVTFDRTFDTTFPNANIQPQDVLITNSGNIETYPTVVIVGHAVNPRVVLTRYDGKQLTVEFSGLTVTAADELVVDFAKRTAIMNTDVDVYGYTIGSDWWALEPRVNGVDNIVSYRATDIQPGSNIDIFWRNAYMI